MQRRRVQFYKTTILGGRYLADTEPSVLLTAFTTLYVFSEGRSIGLLRSVHFLIRDCRQALIMHLSSHMLLNYGA